MAMLHHPGFLIGDDLGENHTGKEVEELQQYLHLAGYLDVGTSDEPRGSSKARLGIFDEKTAEALRQFQRFYRLPATGRFDKVTRTLVRNPQCGEPDTPLQRAFGNPWGKLNLTYCIRAPNDDPELNTVDKVIGALYEGFSYWSAVCPVRFRAVPNNGGCDIHFWFGFEQCGGQACTSSPPGSTMRFLPTESWARSSPTPPGYTDFVAFAVHECGHALGLAHSPNPDSIMYKFIYNNRRRLASEDIANIQSIYGSNLMTWTDKPDHTAEEAR
jgi:hypothetical protein